jgi:hypothetical protein
MTMISFGGIGTEILMFRTQFEKEVHQVDSLMKQIGEQNAVVANASGELSKLFAGDLHKLAGGSDLTKNLTTCKSLLGKVHEEIARLKKLMSECREAQARALVAMSDFAMFYTNGRSDTVPNRSFFLAGKNAVDQHAFELSARREPDPLASLSDVQLGRRFQDRTKGD